MYIRVTVAEVGQGHDVFIDGTLIGVRPYDGTTEVEDIRKEVRQALAGSLRGRLGWELPEKPVEPF